MPEGPVRSVATLPPHPDTPVASPALEAAIRQATATLRPDQRGSFSALLTATGVEVAVAQRGPLGGLFGGYAKRLWGGDWQAAASAQWEW